MVHDYKLSTVSKNDIPEGYQGNRNEAKQELCQEISLRLHSGSNSDAVAIHLENKEEAERMRSWVSVWFSRRFGEKTVKTNVRENGAGYILYVSRGENYR